VVCVGKTGAQVMIAACDTFRSGAVEQLKVHARCLEVDLFDKGWVGHTMMMMMIDDDDDELEEEEEGVWSCFCCCC
jgi:signal recognition particle GTPase